MKTFADYKQTAPSWITMASGEFYPDILTDACELYKPVLITFSQLLKRSESSERLLHEISAIKEHWMRIQLCRVFRKYVSPQTPVEMLKKKSMIPMVCDEYGRYFRTIDQVHAAFSSRPLPDEAICAVLWEYKDRGQKGYDLTERFFNMFESSFPQLSILGPKRAGSDIQLQSIFPDYPNPTRPVDFIVQDATGNPIAVGFIRYDSDRGGAQEDDRTGGYLNCAKEILDYDTLRHRGLKILYINDGPGLLLGSMWDDYSKLESMNHQRIMVLTLRMFKERLKEKWLLKK